MPVEVIAAGNSLGEGILWNGDDECLWWTDIEARRLYRHHLSAGRQQVFEMPERLGSFALIEGSGRLLAAFESGFALVDPETARVDWLTRPELGASGRRFNDGRADRDGRFWAGTMVEDRVEAGDGKGSLYRLDGNGRAQIQETGIAISNGLCWSPDGSQMYFADSAAGEIRRYTFDRERGMLGDRESFARTPDGIYPDGACVDAEGCLWSAQWGGGRVVRYTPAGEIDRILELPVSQPTCVAFAGRGLDLLCVTSARHGLDAPSLGREPNAGHVFVYQVGATGLSESRYRYNGPAED